MVVVLFILRKSIKNFIDDTIGSFAIKKYRSSEGLTMRYESFNSAKDDITKAFEKATNTRILLQLGRGIIGGNNSLLFELAKNIPNGSNIKLLYADKDSKHLSSSVAKTRAPSVLVEWESAINYTEGSIDTLKATKIAIEARKHTEPYLWRLFFFDNDLFVVPYVSTRNNEQYAKVYRYEKNENLSLFKVYENYFEDLWDKQKDKVYEKIKPNPVI